MARCKPADVHQPVYTGRSPEIAPVDATSHSLLHRAGAGAPDAWERLDRLYRPFILGWFRANGAPVADAEDLTQEVLVVVFRELKAFSPSERVGAFRTWLRQVCLHRLQGYRRSRKVRGAPVGGTDFQAQLQHLPDPQDNPAEAWDREHDREILKELYKSLSGDFEEKTLQAFSRVTFDGVAAAQVAAELGITVAAVYIAKSRVLRKLREEAAGLIDESAPA